ncbi:hypothetical protein Pint_09510 [Pistacia integerrima]|uniref:Uncharacterized protein n=1 Tax=Pistacia integerrima TaxID=434235 RepID=A0ACC0XJM4_9ROSI|nr:hypothetical protein Pint_09510 [Pistacia integerrima]
MCRPADRRKQVEEVSRKDKQCYKCQGIEHFAASYPNRQVVTLIKEEEAKPIYDEEVSEESSEGAIVYGDQGECLVVRRTLNVECGRR